MKKAVIFDIDGTLAKISKNEDGTPKRDYSDYDKVDLDEPINSMFEILKWYFSQTVLISGQDKPYLDKVIFITGRKELCRDKTLNWIDAELKKSLYSLYLNSPFPKSWELCMRPDNDHRKAVELKKEIYETKIKGNYDVVMAFDDDPKVCKMYKEQGILTMQVMTKD